MGESFEVKKNMNKKHIGKTINILAILLFLFTPLSLRAADGLETRFHAKNNEELDKEFDRLKASLPPSISVNFQKAFTEVGADFATENLLSSDEKVSQLYKEFDGLTVGQIIDKAKAVQEKVAKRKQDMIKAFPKNFPKSPENPEGYEPSEKVEAK